MKSRCLPLIALCAALGACNTEPDFTLTVDQLSSDIVGGTLGTDSVTSRPSVATEISLHGVFYGGVTCDGITWDGRRQFGGRLTVTISAPPASGCLRIQRRIEYSLTIGNIDPAVYQIEIFHDEPETARGRRSVFTGSFDLRNR